MLEMSEGVPQYYAYMLLWILFCLRCRWLRLIDEENLVDGLSFKSSKTWDLFEAPLRHNFPLKYGDVCNCKCPLLQFLFLQAHQQERKAEQLILSKKYMEAVTCYEVAAGL